MSGTDAAEMQQRLHRWIREQLDAAAEKIGEMGLIDDPLIDVKPAWTLPFSLLLGKARAHGDPVRFKWFICGDTPLDCVDGSVADSPREALRYFAIKWQLDAEKIEAPEASKELISLAESLYPLADDDRLWLQR